MQPRTPQQRSATPDWAVNGDPMKQTPPQTPLSPSSSPTGHGGGGANVGGGAGSSGKARLVVIVCAVSVVLLIIFAPASPLAGGGVAIVTVPTHQQSKEERALEKQRRVEANGRAALDFEAKQKREHKKKTVNFLQGNSVVVNANADGQQPPMLAGVGFRWHGRYHLKQQAANSKNNVTSAPCRGDAYTHGRWVQQYALTAPQSVNDATSQQSSKARFVIPSLPFNIPAEMGGGCDSRGKSLRSDYHSPELSYFWEPATCVLHSFDAAAFCEALGGRDLVLVGDGMTERWALSLLLALGADNLPTRVRRGGADDGDHHIGASFSGADGGDGGGNPPNRNPSERTPICLKYAPPSDDDDGKPASVTKRPSYLQYFESPFLSFTVPRSSSTPKKKKGEAAAGGQQEQTPAWWKALDGGASSSSAANRGGRSPFKEPIVVLSAGSWMEAPTEWEEASPWERRGPTAPITEGDFEDFMRSTGDRLNAIHFKGTLVWRTAVSGHINCMNYSAPLEHLVGEPVAAPGWGKVPQRNAVATRVFRSMGAHVLDIYPASQRMPLGRRDGADCYHYCLPNPNYYFWSQMLQNLLQGNVEGV